MKLSRGGPAVLRCGGTPTSEDGLNRRTFIPLEFEFPTNPRSSADAQLVPGPRKSRVQSCLETTVRCLKKKWQEERPAKHFLEMWKCVWSNIMGK